MSIMKLTFTLTLFILFSCGLQSQDYKMINANSEYYFSNTATNDPYKVYGLKCDSVQSNGSDSAFFPYRTLKQVLPSDSACSMDPNYPIWAGPRISISATNVHKWETAFGDSVLIDPQVAVGDTQVIYWYPNGDRITAIHSFNTFSSFANVTDSIQCHIIEIRDASNAMVPGYWNGKVLILSKDNGVVQMPSIVNFPNDTFMYSRQAAKRLKFGDLYLWQAGDELHENYHITITMVPYGHYYSDFLYNKYILSRTQVNPDSVEFSIRVITHHTSDYPTDNTITVDTITFGVGRFNDYVEMKMPQQTIDSIHIYDLYVDPVDCGRIKMVNHVSNEYFIDSINTYHCVSQNTFEPLYADSILIEGVAGYYYHEYPSAVNFITDFNYKNLYWAIGNDTCGTFKYVGTEELHQVEFRTWPNPTRDLLNFEMPAGFSGMLEIFDLTGKLIRSVPLQANVPVNVAMLADGIYIGKISSGGMQQGYIRFAKN